MEILCNFFYKSKNNNKLICLFLKCEAEIKTSQAINTEEFHCQLNSPPNYAEVENKLM